MAKKISRQKISSIADINEGVLPAQVTDTINIDDANIEVCASLIKSSYAEIESASKALKSTLGSTNSKSFNGKISTQLKKIENYVGNQSKYAEARSAALDKQLKSDRADMSTVIDSVSYITTLEAALADVTTSASVGAVLTALKAKASTELSNAGYTLNDDGTITNGTSVMKVENGKLVKVGEVADTGVTTDGAAALVDDASTQVVSTDIIS